jgi:CHAT domain-containing protein
VIASSVRIEDEASREMAERFYRHWLSGKSRASALRDAQLEMRDRDQWEHPFYWSFLRVLVAGD